jgi:hypothetical protein
MGFLMITYTFYSFLETYSNEGQFKLCSYFFTSAILVMRILFTIEKMIDSTRNINFCFSRFCHEISGLWKSKITRGGKTQLSSLVQELKIPQSDLRYWTADQCACWASAIGRDGMLLPSKTGQSRKKTTLYYFSFRLYTRILAF